MEATMVAASSDTVNKNGLRGAIKYGLHPFERTGRHRS